MLTRLLTTSALVIALAAPALAQSESEATTEPDTTEEGTTATTGLEAEGKIESIDPEAGTLTLDTGEEFTIGEGVSTEGLEEGQDVSVGYDERGGEKEAGSIEAQH
jgi:hypothetical protein